MKKPPFAYANNKGADQLCITRLLLFAAAASQENGLSGFRPGPTQMKKETISNAY